MLCHRQILGILPEHRGRRFVQGKKLEIMRSFWCVANSEMGGKGMKRSLFCGENFWFDGDIEVLIGASI